MNVISETAITSAPHYNEASVRFHILNPIIQSLGYPETEDTYLHLEEQLEYPYIHIGRRSKRDVPMGFADYRAGVKGARGSFIIEAKAGDVPITQKEIEQAHSYAAHAQVGANYFVLANGSEVLVFETLSGPQAVPILEIPLVDLNKRFHELENILAPSSLSRNCRVKYDTKLKLADGLGSFIRVRSGRYLLSEHDVRIIVNGQDCTQLVRQSVPQFSIMEDQLELMKSAFEMQVSDGIAERDTEGKIVARVEFWGVTVHNQAAMAIMGIDKASFATSDQFLSTDPSCPSIFESQTDFKVARGTALPELFGGNVEMAGDVLGNMFIRVAMHYADGTIAGQYVAFSDQEVSIPGQIPFVLEMDLAGSFEMEIDV